MDSPRISRSISLQTKPVSPHVYAGAEAVTIEIVESEVKSSTLHKHVLYAISVRPRQGQDESTTFSIHRRYRDFRALRDCYAEKWPGVFIPPVPGKVTFVLSTQGNTEPNFILIRKHLLEVFLQKIVSVPFLYGSEEFQLFIRSSTDFKPLLGKKPLPSIRTNASTYITTFPEYDITEVQPKVEDALATFKLALSTLIVVMSNLTDAIKRTCSAASMFTSSQTKLNECFQAFYNVSSDGKTRNKVFQLWKNTSELEGFRKLNSWAQVEVMDLRALQESFHSLESMKSQKSKRIASLAKSKHKLETLISEKQAKKRQDLTHKIGTLEQEIESYSRTVNIAVTRLYDFEIPRFRETRVTSYYTALRVFTAGCRTEAQSALDVLSRLM